MRDLEHSVLAAREQNMAELASMEEDESSNMLFD